MKFFIVLSAFIALAYCKPSVVPSIVAPVVAVSAPVQTQYHAQDGLGQYVYGYSNELSAKNEVKSVDGSTVGTYSYFDPSGKLQTVQYAADSINGFRAVASNLPVAPPLPVVPSVAPPRPVEDTPEVAEAKAKHLAEFEEIKKSFKAPVPTIDVKSAVVAPLVTVKSAPPTTNFTVNSTENIIATRSGILTPTIFSPAVAAPLVSVPAVDLRASIPTTQFLSIPAFHGYHFSIKAINGAGSHIAHQPAVLAYSSPFISGPVVHLQAAQSSSEASSEVTVKAKKSDEPKESEKTENSQ